MKKGALFNNLPTRQETESSIKAHRHGVESAPLGRNMLTGRWMIATIAEVHVLARLIQRFGSQVATMWVLAYLNVHDPAEANPCKMTYMRPGYLPVPL